MERRKFIKTAGGFMAIGPSVGTMPFTPKVLKNKVMEGQENFRSSIEVRGNKIFIETLSMSAIMQDGLLVSLKNKSSGEEYIREFDRANLSALQLVYPDEETVEFSENNFTRIQVHQVSGQRAEIFFHCWHGDGVMTLWTDDESGDLVVEPSAYSSRPGVMACRWTLPGLDPDLYLVAPFFQGVKLRLYDPLVSNTRWGWPFYWEAALAILESSKGGMYVFTQDEHYRYKALKVGTNRDPFTIGMDTETYGPTDQNLAAGGLAWRINVFKGDWKVPATRYRDWLWKTYQLHKEEEKRKPWMNDIRLALSWCPGDAAILDALSKKISPSRVLIHFPDWRTDEYDQNYPDYKASEKGKFFIKKCQETGFHVMPHFNANDMDPSHPVYSLIRDFQYRDIETKQIKGWSWVNGRVLGVPESNESRMNNRKNNVMVKVHPGLSMWRSILGENILRACRDLTLDTVFIDVTLVSLNLYNSLVENTTSTEGMKKLISHIGSLEGGKVVAGEGLNEITMQGQSFAQAHLFKSWQVSADGLERTGGCDLNQFLFGKLCKIIGYSGMSGKNQDEETRMQIHLEHGGIPTLVIRSAEEILRPNPAVKKMFELANA